MLKIFLVDDSTLVRQRMATLLGLLKGVEIVGEAEGANAAVEGVAATHADVAVVDLRLTEGSGLDVLAGLAQSNQRTITIMLTNHSGASFRKACLSAGAHYFFDKTSEFHLARDAIERLARERLAETTEHTGADRV
ncbi:response regulator [Paraburkholderia fungorum]|uniref:Response regulator n=1 Tax=Paraburkholderia fungorum TaxID=134537 RepID=A0AAU8ST15_9BURK|nr:response regulator transcription factor [Paraburkholderia fungorum]AJZ56715.1 response regulator [Paraburkholderia fungorum]